MLLGQVALLMIACCTLAWDQADTAVLNADVSCQRQKRNGGYLGPGRWGELGVTHPLLLQGDLLSEPLFGKVAHRIVVSIGQEVRQLVLSLGIFLQSLRVHSCYWLISTGNC